MDEVSRHNYALICQSITNAEKLLSTLAPDPSNPDDCAYYLALDAHKRRLAALQGVREELAALLRGEVG